MVIGLAAILGIVAANWLTGPLRALGRAAERMSSGDLTPQLPTSGTSEIADVAGAFGMMRHRLTVRAAESAHLLRQQAAYAEEINERNHELEVLQELSDAVLQSDNLDAVLNRVLDYAMAIGPFDLGVIRLLESDGTRLPAAVARGYLDPEDTTRHRSEATDPRTGSFSFNSLEGRHTRVIPDLAAHPGFRTLRREGVVSLVVVPVQAGDEVLGLIQLGCRQAQAFGAAPVRLLEAIGSHMGTAVQKARLLDETRRAYADLQATEERQQRLVEIIEATTDLVSIATKAGRRLYMNRAGRSMLGIAPDLDIATTGLGDFHPEAAQESLYREALPTARLNGVVSYETAYQRSNGEVFPTSSVLLVHKDSAGDIAYYSTIARDISSLKQMEAQVLRGQRLETAGRIAGQVAHDFNNLLAPLVGYPELIKMHLPEGHPALAYCDAMLDAAQQMASISEDLLALGRRAHFNQESIAPGSLIERVLAQQGGWPESLTVQRSIAPDLLPVLAAPAQLMRVFANLITNAREAMNDAGKLRIVAENVYLDRPIGGYTGVAVGEYVRIDVGDTGPGMSPEVRDRVFDAFFTTKQASRRRGSGLGLSVVQSIVEDHGGYLDVQSEVGLGAVFSLFLPICRTPVVVGSTDDVERGSEHILIVDDDERQRAVARELLETLGYHVDCAESGEQALGYLERSAVDLLVLDMVMPPGLDGADTYRQVLDLRPGTRAIVLSGFAESERVRITQELGAGPYVRKPVTLEKLGRAVRVELDRDRVLTTA